LCSDLENLKNIRKDEFDKYKEKMITFEQYNKVEQSINKKIELLIKIEDRLFLNPVSRIKSIPKKPQEEKEESGLAALLGGGRPGR
jgi:hypothetical protein